MTEFRIQERLCVLQIKHDLQLTVCKIGPYPTPSQLICSLQHLSGSSQPGHAVYMILSTTKSGLNVHGLLCPWLLPKSSLTSLFPLLLTQSVV